MSIEINSNSLNPKRQSDVSGNTAKQAVADKKAAQQRAADQAKADDATQVRLSEDAQSLQRVQETLERQDSFDTDRVEQIKQAIGEGRYPIDNDRLARRFLELETQLSQ